MKRNGNKNEIIISEHIYQTNSRHYIGAIGRYGDRPIAFAGDTNVETELYNWQ